MKPLAPITYDYSGLIAPKDAPPFVRQTGLVEADLKWLAPRLAAARQEVLDNLALYERGGPVPEEMQPLDAAFFDLPERLLDEDRPLLDRIIAAGDRLAKEVDRVVVLGIGGSYMGARALFEACCHPYHNEISRQRRGGRPRIYFEGNNVDNDAVQGLLDLVEGSDDWGIIVISKSGGTLETAVAFRVFLDALRKSCGGDQEKLRRRVIPVTGESGRLRDLAEALGCHDVFPIPDGVGGRFSVLSAVGLLPAAVMGLDVHHLLEGAAAMNERFRTAPPLENPVLDYVGHDAADGDPPRGHHPRAFHLGQGPGGGRTVVRPAPLRKPGQERPGRHAADGRQHPRPPFPRPAAPGRPPRQADHEPRRRAHAPRAGSPSSRRSSTRTSSTRFPARRCPTCSRRPSPARTRPMPTTSAARPRSACPGSTKARSGSLFQMLMLATVVEGRLVGINPYGQPGVEAYKKNMNAILRGK